MGVERSGDTKGTYARIRGIENAVDDSRRKEAEWKANVGEARFTMTRGGSRAEQRG